MAKKRSLHIWLEENEHRRLEEIAADRRVSVAEVIRSAVRELVAGSRMSREAAAESLCGLELSLTPWPEMEARRQND